MDKRVILFFLAGCIAFTACKKNDAGAVAPPPAGTRLELSLDSLYLYAKETYLWYQSLPEYNSFAPRQYAATSPDMTALQTALQAITGKAINPATGISFEYRTGYFQPLYSFIAKGNIITGRSASVGLDGKGNDLGLGFAVANNTDVYIRFVEPGSPAAAAGLTRGMKIVEMNGVPATANSVELKSILEAADLSLLVQNKAGSLLPVLINRASYTASPVLKTSILETGSKKAAYIALARFSEPANAQAALQQAFASFGDNDITNLVIDLRYNAGGYVETAQYLANLIAPASINGQVMYTEHYNNLLQQGKAPILKQIPYLDANRQPVYVNGRPATYADADYTVKGNTYRFDKKGDLNGIRSVVFIVSGGTASASEQLINCLRPYVDVKLVGSTTYGKPVGFFGIGIDVYTVYLAQFRILNARDEGDYYAGSTPDLPAMDDVTHDFGDPEESCLQQALQYISRSPFRPGRQDMRIHTVTSVGGREPFTGMIETRLPLK
jgi:carboxyl-terminal processing protease